MDKTTATDAGGGGAAPDRNVLGADQWRARRASLDDREGALYRAILRGFAEGRSVDRSRLAALAGEVGVESDRTLAKLERLDLVRRAADGAVVVAYPFSARPTAHRVGLGSETVVYAMCAVDALGISFMLGAPTEIRSRDPLTGDDVDVRVGTDGVEWKPAEAVVVVAAAGDDGPLASICCPLVNFFASAETALRYLADRPHLEAAVVSIPEASERGRLIFGDALDERNRGEKRR